MPPDPNQGKCVHCAHYTEKEKGEPKHICKVVRRGGWDFVLDSEWDEEVDCYKVNTDGGCPVWEAIP